MDLEAVEMAIRSAMHHAGAAVLTQLLEFDPPGPDQRQLPCSCGRLGKYLLKWRFRDSWCSGSFSTDGCLRY
jgi:hypothetical protein